MFDSTADTTSITVGIAILYKKPSKLAPSTFSFMSPYSTEVWAYLGAAYLSVSCCLFALGRISPAEWDNPYPCIEDPTHLENQFSFTNSMWFAIGALLQQGSEIAPKYVHSGIWSNIFMNQQYKTNFDIAGPLLRVSLRPYGGSSRSLWSHPTRLTWLLSWSLNLCRRRFTVLRT